MQKNIYMLSHARDTLTIRGIDNILLACISTAMPEALRHDLEERLLACFDMDPLTDRDSSASPSGKATFEALHFSWYNRHCTKVCNI